MFSGIVEGLGKVSKLVYDKGNLHLTIQCSFTNELKIDQSVAHNGICLTVVEINENEYTVTAIAETLAKTNLGKLKIGDLINLERCMKLGDRLDGHIVQGHVDQTAQCIQVVETNGSWMYTFVYEPLQKDYITVEKGSICVNGVSLTVVNSTTNSFSVCIIPFTFEHTNFNSIKVDTIVNLEFDVLGKYIYRLALKTLSA